MRAFFALLLFLNSLLCLSQSTGDVARIMTEDVSGTARTKALGGAQSALGADIGSIQYNPANIGMFRSSQAAVSAGLIFNTGISSYLNVDNKVTNGTVALDNLGVVFSATDDDNNKFKSYSIGFSYNRRASFRNNFELSGINSRNSFTTYLGEQTTQQTTAEPDALNRQGLIDKEAIQNISELSWISNLIKDPINDSLYTGVAENGGVFQTYLFQESGIYNDWDISLGTNYNDIVYIGAGVGIQYYEYGYKEKLKENDVEDTIPDFIGYEYNKDYLIQGTATNLKVGTIVRPIDWFRFGFSVETPTVFNLESEQNILLKDVIINEDLIQIRKEFEIAAPATRNKIKIRTPMKYTLGMVFLAGKYGLITADFERINYANAVTKNAYDALPEIKNVNNFRLGVEGRYDNFRARLGLALNGNLSTNNNALKGNRYYTLGAGYKTDTYFIDIAFITTRTNYIQSPYNLVSRPDPTAEIQQSVNSISITVGSRF